MTFILSLFHHGMFFCSSTSFPVERSLDLNKTLKDDDERWSIPEEPCLGVVRRSPDVYSQCVWYLYNDFPFFSRCLANKSILEVGSKKVIEPGIFVEAFVSFLLLKWDTVSFSWFDLCFFFGWTKQKVGIVHVKRNNRRFKRMRAITRRHSLFRQTILRQFLDVNHVWQELILSSSIFKWSFESLPLELAMSDSTSLDWLNKSPFSCFRFARVKALWLQPPAEHKSRAGHLKWGWGFVGRWRCSPLQLYRCCRSKSMPLLKLPKISGKVYIYFFCCFFPWVASVLWVWFSWADFLHHIFPLRWSNMGEVLSQVHSTYENHKGWENAKVWQDPGAGMIFLPEVFFRNSQWGGCFCGMILGWVKLGDKTFILWAYM